MKRLIMCFGLLALGIPAGNTDAAGMSGLAVQASEQVDEILARTRRALGGQERLAAVTTLTAEGPFRRVMGAGELEGTITLTLGLPDQLRHEEEVRVFGDAVVVRFAGMNGDHVWEDTTTPAGPPGRAVRLRPTGGDPEQDPELARQMRQRRLSALHQRMTLALLLSGGSLSYAGVAQTGEGEADVLETEDANGHAVRLLISRDSDLPLAVSYREVRPVMMAGGPGAMRALGMGGRPGGPGSPESGRRVEASEPPPPSTIVMRFEDFRRVDGLLLPHLMVQVVDGEPAEEWTVKKYQVNPPLESEVFDKK